MTKDPRPWRVGKQMKRKKSINGVTNATNRLLRHRAKNVLHHFVQTKEDTI